MRKIYILPNLFTAGSLFFGVFSLFESLGGNFSDACIMIVLAGVLDTFDGAVARLTRTTSAFGVNFDSLADVVSFGVAPAILAYQTLEFPGGDVTDIAPVTPMVKAVCCLFVICSAMRLARYNVQAAREESRRFTGLPTPAAAGAIVLLAWVAAEAPGVAETFHFEKVMPTVMVAIAYLMVSKAPFVGLKTLAAGRQPFENLVICVIFACFVVMLRSYTHFLLFGLVYIYLFVSLFSGVMENRRLAAAAPEPKTRAGHE